MRQFVFCNKLKGFRLFILIPLSLLFIVEVKGQDLFPIINYKNHFGFINTQGDIIIKPEFDCVLGFSEGLAAVLVNNKWGYIDTTGLIIIENTFDSACSFSNGLALVFRDAYAGYVNRAGNIVIPFVFVDGMAFSEGLACVQTKDKLWNYIDKTGRIIIPNVHVETVFDYGKYDLFYYLIPFFKSGLVALQSINTESNSIFIDYNGKKHYFPKSSGFEFSDGVISFSENNRVGFLDTNNTVVITPKYLMVSRFLNGKSWVLKDIGSNANYQLLYIDKNDSILFSFLLKDFGIPSSIINIGNNKCLILNKENDDYTYINTEGDVLTITYENRISLKLNCKNFAQSRGESKFENTLFMFFDNGIMKYIDMKGNTVWSENWKCQVIQMVHDSSYVPK